MRGSGTSPTNMLKFTIHVRTRCSAYDDAATSPQHAAFAMSLKEAILRGDATAVRALLAEFASRSPSASAARDAGVSDGPEEGFAAAVTTAAVLGHVDVIQTLCELLPPPHPPLPFDIAADDNVVLRVAAQEGQVALVRYLCGLPASFCVAPGARRNAALVVAAENHHEDVVRLLCALPPERGVRPGARDNQALRAAARSGHAGIVRLLCELPPARGVDPSAKHNDALCGAAGCGRTEVVEYLCQLPPERGVDPAVEDNMPLLLAAQSGQLEVVRHLCELPVERGVDLTARNNYVLRCAGAYEELLKYLCGLPPSYGIDPGAYPMVLTIPASYGYLETVRFLCMLPRWRGVDPAADDCDAVLAAAAARHDDVVAFMCRLGPADGFPSQAKVFLLREALHNGFTSVVRNVCSLPASVGVSSADMRRLLHDASKNAPVAAAPLAAATCRAVLHQALLWRGRRRLLTLRVLRESGHVTAKRCVGPPAP